MTPERYQQVNRLLDEVLELSPEERAAHLSAACAGDEELRLEVESLLEAHAEAQSFIESSAAAEAAELLGERKGGEMIGRTLGHYELRSLLGAGGMGEVYRATDTRLEREVAIKILPAHMEQDAEALHRFEREAKAVAALSHPNVCGIYDFGIEQGVTYAVMELLEGENLRVRLATSALPWREAAEIGIAVADGLAAAHAKGIIHRDLKPENIFLTAGGQVKVLDFGIARVKRIASPEAETGMATMTETTRPGTMIGTVGYMSPEQVKGETAEATSDIFSLGCVLYEMVSGRRPFARGNTMETLAAILKEDPLDLAESGKAIPTQVERVIRHCLEKQPGGRYQSARDLASDLRVIFSESGQTISAPRAIRRRIRPAVLMVASLLLLAVIALSLYLFAGREKPIDSIAILPLVNASGDANLDYLSDGITESLINALSQLPQLRVMGRGTVFTYKDKEVDPRKVGQELGVRAVFTGKVVQRDDTLSIQADLVRAADGTQIWGERSTHKLTDLQAMQEQIARQISERLQLKMSGAQQQRLTKRHTDDLEAHQLYLKGRYHWNKYDEQGLKRSVALFKQAIDRDPNYALAYAGLADAYFGMSNLYLAPSEAIPISRGAALKALQLDETLGEAHAALAVVKAYYEWEWEEGERAFKRAIELNPSYASVRNLYGVVLVQLKRFDEAQIQINRARELDPLSAYIHVGTVWPVLFRGRYDQALEQLRGIVALNPNFANAHLNLSWAYEGKGMYEEAVSAARQAKSLDKNWFIAASLGYIYARAGRTEEARRELTELRQRDAREFISDYGFAMINAGLGEREAALAALEKALEVRDEYMPLINVFPFFDGLRAEPRFVDLLRRMHLAP